MTHEPIDFRLAELRQGMQAVRAPAHLEAALAARFRREHGAARRPRLWWLPPLALAATIALVSWMVRGPLPAADGRLAAPAEPALVEEAPFLALKPLERIALEPSTTVVEAEFPRALLAGWGLPVSPDRAAEPVRAELLYSADGEPLAVRLIH